MNEYADLARIIHAETCSTTDAETCRYYEGVCGNAAVAALIAGYGKPRTIATMEELNALPTGSVVLDAGRHSYQRSHISGWTGCDASTVYRDGDLLGLPATVLYTPKETA